MSDVRKSEIDKAFILDGIRELEVIEIWNDITVIEIIWYHMRVDHTFTGTITTPRRKSGS